MMLWWVEWEGKFGFAWRIVKDVMSCIAEIMRFKRHVPPNLRAYILDTTMSWGHLQLVVKYMLMSSPSMPLG